MAFLAIWFWFYLILSESNVSGGLVDVKSIVSL